MIGATESEALVRSWSSGGLDRSLYLGRLYRRQTGKFVEGRAEPLGCNVMSSNTYESLVFSSDMVESTSVDPPTHFECQNSMWAGTEAVTYLGTMLTSNDGL